jgi:hypothetical protein
MTNNVRFDAAEWVRRVRRGEREVFCCAPHPSDRDGYCKRLDGHDGDHAAYTFLISKPETWCDAEIPVEFLEPVELDAEVLELYPEGAGDESLSLR